MSCLKKSFTVNKDEKLSETKASESSDVKTVGVEFTCGECSMLYTDYKHLLEHLYWRHGTESFWCRKCSLKYWRFAPHVCHVLPIYIAILDDNEEANDDDKSEEENHPVAVLPQAVPERQSDYCSCGKFVEGSDMIGCDEKQCLRQWYHFECVGVTKAPPGEWFCRDCKLRRQLNTLAKM